MRPWRLDLQQVMLSMTIVTDGLFGLETARTLVSCERLERDIVNVLCSS